MKGEVIKAGSNGGNVLWEDATPPDSTAASAGALRAAKIDLHA